MDKVKALIYLNQCGDKKLESKAMDMLFEHCKKQDYEPVFAFSENTGCTGLSAPIKYMLIGMAAEMKIDVVITMFSGMISMHEDELFDTMAALDNYGVMIETVRNDMECYYEELYKEQGIEESEEEMDDNKFISFMAQMWDADDEQFDSDNCW